MSAQATLVLDPEWEHGWDRPHSGTARKVTSLHASIHSNPPFVPMWEFEACDGTRVATQRPVNVSIQLEEPSHDFDNHAFLFACPSLHVYASAISYHEAERQFQDQVVYFYNHYTSLDSDQLDDDARTIQDIYRKYFFESVRA